MPIPGRSEQARQVAEWLDHGAEEGEDLDKFSLRIVDAFHEMLKQGLKGPVARFQTGDAFKSPLSSKVYWVAYEENGQYWITQADSTYGWLINRDDEFFRLASPSSAKTGKPGENKDGWKKGDRLSSFQGSLKWEVVAVHDRGVMLRDRWNGSLMPEGNENMAKYYTKEK